MSVDTPRVRQIFLDAVEGHSPEQWPAYLDEACAGDAELRRRVEVLLRAHCDTAGIIDELTEGPERIGPVSSPDVSPGTTIGPYKLLERIGEGGMGEVWMAEQRQPMHRKVALKIIKAGMDTRSVVARFEAERQALALMDHPNIAKVFDGGTTGERDEGGGRKDEQDSSLIPHPSRAGPTS